MWVPEEPFHAVKLRKYFIHMRVNIGNIIIKIVKLKVWLIVVPLMEVNYLL